MSTSKEFYIHTPGHLSRTGVLDVGLKCTHSCKFCYYSFMADRKGQHDALRKAPFRNTKDCLKIIELMASHGLTNFDITGGEPTLHAGLEEMVSEARQNRMTVRLITLGQFLLGKKNTHLLDCLLHAGITDILFSLHASSEEKFREATGGSLQKILKTMDALDSHGFEYSVNTVIHSGNIKDLPHIATISANKGVYHHNFIAFNAYHKWNLPTKIQNLQAPYSKIAPYLSQAVDILHQAGVAVTLRYIPLCVQPNMSHLVVGVTGVHYDPHEWRNRAGNVDKAPEYCATPLPIEPDKPRDIHALHSGINVIDFGNLGSVFTVAQRGDNFKIFPEICAQCEAMHYCDGIDPKYVLLHGTQGLSPFSKMNGQGVLTEGRQNYAPAYFMKQSQTTKLKNIIKQYTSPFAHF